MNDYEMVYIVSPRLSSEEGERTTAWVDGLIRENGGELLSTDVWGRRRLAYPIQHQFEGTYVYTTFRLDPAATVRIESALGLSEDVLRHLVIRGIVEGGRPEAQPARLMSASRQAPPPPPVAASSVDEQPATEQPAEAAVPASESNALDAATEAAVGPSASAAETTEAVAEPEPARTE